MSKNNFEKFFKKKSNAAIKEQFRQEKRKVKKEREAFFDKKKKQKPESENSVTGNRSGKKILPEYKSLDRKQLAPDASMPLNKFIAHCGVCSRRDAAELVKESKVSVNGIIIVEPGHKVSPSDIIKLNGKKLSISKNLIYLLLNKPKDCLTTAEDPQGRKTVLDIVGNATGERVFPVGRLDRNTTGVLLLTNDGDLAQKLTHPSFQVKKIYEVKLNRVLTKSDFETLLKGIHLEDGFIAPDSMAYADARDKSVIGIEIHSGKNRIVRRMFEKLGYSVKSLDRVLFANLTKKYVERGKWRFLKEKEVRLLKHLNSSFIKKKSQSVPS